MTKPCIEAIPSTFGGGWVVPLDSEGRAALREYFGEAAYPIAPLGGEPGYIVEPPEVADLLAYFKDNEYEWRLG